MQIKLSEHFNYKKLFRFTVPSVIMVIFTSIYGVVDGLFVSNFAGKTSFAAINLIMPFLMAGGAICFMLGTGGSALVAKILGEGNEKKANGYFSMIITVAVISGIVVSILGIIFLRPIAVLLGATNNLIEDCVIYGRIILVFSVAFILQGVFQSFFIAAEKPKLGLYLTVAAGVSNIIFDALFVGLFKLGIVGAAIATGIGEIIGCVIPIIYFYRKNTSLLRLVKPVFNARALLKVCTNGSSELMTNLSLSIVNMLYNFQLIKICGENGVAAYGVIMYVNFIFISIFLGYAIGSAPLISYNYGAGNARELKNLFKKSLIITSLSSVFLLLLAEISAAPLCKIFVGYDKALYELTLNGFRIYSLSFLICGFNIYASSFFTALNNGAVSAVISFLRTLLFQIAAVMLLPLVFGVDGIFSAIIAAEILSLFISAFFFVTKRKRYKY